MNQETKRLMDQMSLEEKVALLHGDGLWKTHSIDRLNIPDIVMTDGTHGVRYNIDQIEKGVTDFGGIVSASAQDIASGDESTYHTKPATCFPNGSSVACSFDTGLVRAMGSALGTECQSMGVGILLGPGINIRRTPLAGRGYEYYSEDPVVSGDLAAAMIEGIQGEGVGTSLKHIACNNSEHLRTTTDSVVEERALREIYLHGFERAIQKSSPWTLMSSYNLLNGYQASNNEWLLKKVIRDEWGYEGLIMSDWLGVIDKIQSLRAGNDLEMPEENYNAEALLEAAQADPSLVERIDEACGRVLELVFRVHKAQRKDVTADYDAHHELARSIAAESIVLLKNEDGILPIRPGSGGTIAVVGRGAARPVIQGSGCATTPPTRVDIPLEKLRELAGEKTEVRYASGCAADDSADPALLAEAVETASAADLVILFANTPVNDNGEDSDLKDLNLCPAYEELIEKLSAVNPNLVVVLSNGDAIVMPWLSKAKAVLETFFSGQGMGAAVAELLFGNRNPSGKLTVTMPCTLEETPAFLHYPGENGRHLYSEGIYVGYRYYDKRRMTPAFPFGFGLSYTTFAYENLRVSTEEMRDDTVLRVEVDVRNTGERFGKEIVQLYIEDPASRLPRPVRELKGFCKLALRPGETGTAVFELGARDFSYFDPSYQRWIFESGSYLIQIGRNSRELLLSCEIQGKARLDYPAYLHENVDMVAFFAHPSALRLLVEQLVEQMGVDEQSIRQKLEEKMEMPFMHLRSALQSALGRKLSGEDYRRLICGINEKHLAAQADAEG